MAERLLSWRDRLIVARHEVGWTGVWTFHRAWVRVFGPTGHESLAQKGM
jgi:hypothetical protein